MGVAALFALVLTWKKLHNIVLGGGDAAASDDSRHEQWALGWPHIYANPLTGHGIGTGGQVVNWHGPNGALSIDTYALNLLVETGVPGFVFYFGMILVGAGLMIRIYLRDRDRGAEIGAAIASSLIAYGVYRLVLSQRENQTLFFIFLGIVFVVAQESAKRLTKKNDGGAALKSGAPRKPRSPDQNEYLR
jgi:O-antigen ligase